MATRPSVRHQNPVTIHELPEFDNEAKRRLDANTLRALYLLLSENPLAGVTLPGYPGLLELNYAGHRILYAVGSRLSKLYLLRFLEPTYSPPPSTSADGKALRKAFNKLVQAGTLLAIREALREPIKQLWELIKHWP